MPNLSKALRVVATMALAAVAVVAINGAPASASVGTGFETWTDVNYHGHYTTAVGPISDLRDYGINDAISSLTANGTAYCVFTDVNFGGRMLRIDKHVSVADLRSYNINDAISSFKPC